jgi:hypothetical protein
MDITLAQQTFLVVTKRFPRAIRVVAGRLEDRAAARLR